MGLCAKTLNTSYRWVNGHFGTEKRSRAWAAKAYVVSVKVDWALYLIQNQFSFLNKLFRLAKQLDDWDFKCEIWQIHHVTLPSDSFFSWLEYDQTNQHRFRRKRRELRSGFSCDSNRKPLRPCKQCCAAVLSELDDVSFWKWRTKNITKGLQSWSVLANV